MSLTQSHGDHVFHCDGKNCRETLETGTSNFEAAQNILKRSRWKPVPRRVPGGYIHWDHLCPECKEGAKLPLARVNGG